jgi:hypothetical protein|tara:strand:- start:293 stop:607 length:315 start_codon:yes stop_codon:yes gene_type:complete
MQLLTTKKMNHVSNIYNSTFYNIKIFNRLKYNKMNYTITNKQTKVKHNLNGKEAANFYSKNNYKNYIIKEDKKDLFDLLPLWFIVAAMSLGFAASLLLYIKLNY